MTEIANSLGQTNNAEGILGLAQKLYDEHVAEGEATKSRLINEAEVEAERILFEAKAEAERLRTEADDYHETVISDADREVQEVTESSADRIAAIHANISSLQQFEAHYRHGLEKLLEDTKSLLDQSVEKVDEKVENSVEENNSVVEDTLLSEEPLTEETLLVDPETEEENTLPEGDELISEVLPAESADLETDERLDSDDEDDTPSGPVYVL